jgi:hypothetical protein
MWKTFFQDGALMALPVASMVVFFGVFLIAVARVLVRGRGDGYARAARLPFDQEPAAKAGSGALPTDGGGR